MSISYWHWANKTEWGGKSTSDFAASDNGGAQTTQNGSLAPFSQDWVTGYQPQASALQTSQTMKALNAQSNANLCDPAFKMTLWVNDVQADFGMTGTEAQSHTTRDFYPQAFSLPYFAVSGQCPDEENYGRLTEYVHAANRFSIGAGNMGKLIGKSTHHPLIQLYIAATPYVNLIGGQSGATKVVRVNKVKGKTTTNSNQMIVGPHEEIICKGYVGSFTRQHQQGVFQPTWTMQFQVVTMIKGLWNDTVVSEGTTNTWVGILNATQSTNLSTKGNIQQNKKKLGQVSSSSANVTNTL